MHTFKAFYRSKRLFQFTHTYCFILISCANHLAISYISTHKEVILPLFQNIAVREPCTPAVIIRHHVLFIAGQHNHLGFTGLQFFCFGKVNQHSGRLSQFTLGFFHVQLNNFLAGSVSCIGYNNATIDTVLSVHINIPFYRECGIRKTISEGIHHLIFCQRFKITISHIDIFCIEVLHFIAKILCGRIIFNLIGNGITHFTGGILTTHQKIYNAVTAFHAPLPCVHDSTGIVLLHPFHIHNIANIQHYRYSFKCSAYLFK